MNERFLRAARCEPVDATPVWFMRQAGRSLPEYRRVRERATLAEIVRDPALCAEVTIQPVRRLAVDAAILFADITTPLPGICVDVEIVDGVGPVIGHPIRRREDLDRLPVTFDVDTVRPLLDAIGLLRRELDVPLIGFAGAPFTLASYLVEGGPKREALALRRLIHGNPVLAADLFDRVTTMTIAYLGAQVEAGVQAVQVFDSWIGALGPFDYERAVAPHMRRLFEALGGLGVPTIHFGTGAAGLLEKIAAAGGDVIGLDWRIALHDGWARVPGRAVQGNLDPAVLLGPWDAVERQARWVLDEAGGRPGHIFNLGHGVLPETDPDQLKRLVELVHETSSQDPGSPRLPPSAAR
jgi:uroporphyrinogen decarboxylase